MRSHRPHPHRSMQGGKSSCWFFNLANHDPGVGGARAHCGSKRKFASCMEPHEAKQTISLGTPTCILVHVVNMHGDTKSYLRLSLCPPGPSGGMVILLLLHDLPVWPPTDLGNPLDNGLDFKPLLSGCRVGT
jgi:hypothetical protein